MFAEPSFENLLHARECFDHRRFAIGHWVDPDGITHRNLDPAGGAVRHAAITALDLQRVIGDVGNGHDLARGEGAAESAPHLAAVTDHGDVIVISDLFSL